MESQYRNFLIFLVPRGTMEDDGQGKTVGRRVRLGRKEQCQKLHHAAEVRSFSDEIVIRNTDSNTQTTPQ